MDFLEASHCVAADGAVDLDLNKSDLTNIFDTAMPPDLLQEYQRSKDNILEAILQSRYSNLHNLLGDHLSEESYLRIVRNKILVTFRERISCFKFSLPIFYNEMWETKRHSLNLFSVYVQSAKARMATRWQ